MGVHEGHRDRMKREFLQGGLRHFSEPRVLELLLFYSRLQGDVNPLAHRLLEAFGSLSGVLDASPADLAAGVVNLVLQAIGTMTVLACQSCDTQTVILTGSMTTLDQVQPNFENFERLYGIRYIIPENATFATAIGAGLCSLQKKAVD